MIKLGKEPEGLLLKKADIFAWAVGLTEAQWDKIRPHIETVKLPGCSKPFYRKNTIRAKLINPMLGDQA
jgi:hypothetical protein